MVPGPDGALSHLLEQNVNAQVPEESRFTAPRRDGPGSGLHKQGAQEDNTPAQGCMNCQLSLSLVPTSPGSTANKPLRSFPCSLCHLYRRTSTGFLYVLNAVPEHGTSILDNTFKAY